MSKEAILPEEEKTAQLASEALDSRALMMNSRALMMDSRALMTPPPNPTELHVTGVLLSKMTQALAYRMLRSRLYILVKKHN